VEGGSCEFCLAFISLTRQRELTDGDEHKGEEEEDERLSLCARVMS